MDIHHIISQPNFAHMFQKMPFKRCSLENYLHNTQSSSTHTVMTCIAFVLQNNMMLMHQQLLNVGFQFVSSDTATAKCKTQKWCCSRWSLYLCPAMVHAQKKKYVKKFWESTKLWDLHLLIVKAKHKKESVFPFQKSHLSKTDIWQTFAQHFNYKAIQLK